MKKLFLLCSLLLLTLHPAHAFLSDYFSTPKTSYILALSWSPTYCETEAVEKGREDGAQCSAQKPYKFVVHGLWPQGKNNCKTNSQQPNAAQIARMRALMPDDGLIKHQWRKHGTCSGKSVDGYFDDIEKARAKIVIPQILELISSPLTFSKDELKAQFASANPALKPNQFTLSCKGNKLREVRMCMDSKLNFENCQRLNNSCPNNGIYVPPAR